MRGGMTDPPSGIVGLMRGFLYPVKDARIIAELALYVAVTRVAIRLRALVRRPRRREGDRHGGRRPHARRARVRLGGRYGLCATGVSVPECWHYRERERDPRLSTPMLDQGKPSATDPRDTQKNCPSALRWESSCVGLRIKIITT